ERDPLLVILVTQRHERLPVGQVLAVEQGREALRRLVVLGAGLVHVVGAGGQRYRQGRQAEHAEQCERPFHGVSPRVWNRRWRLGVGQASSLPDKAAGWKPAPRFETTSQPPATKTIISRAPIPSTAPCNSAAFP